MLDNEYYSKEAIYNRRKKRIRAIRRKRIFRFFLSITLIIVLITSTVKITTSYIKKRELNELRERQLKTAETIIAPEWVDIDIIDKHGVARTGEKITAVSNIIVHYVGNPGTTAKNNRDFFNSNQSNVSAHFIVGLKGEIIQCVPLNEKSSASNWRNSDSISIEVCHPDESGEFNENTYNSLVKLTAWLCKEFELKSDDVMRHYDVTGKLCPLYYVNNPDKWDEFKEDVATRMEKNNP